MEISPMADSVRRAETQHYTYFSKAREEAMRRKLRNQRNTVEFSATLQASQSAFDNWSAGGQNTFTTRGTIFFRHQYRRESIAIESKFDGRLGMNIIDDKPFKNEDEFKLGSTALIPMTGDLFYDGTVNLRSQFANGYAGRNDRTKKSSFMSPGFLDAALGVTYRPHDMSYLSMTLSPISTNLITVIDDELSQKGLNGVEPGKHTKGQLGPSMRVDFDLEFGKKVFRFRSNFYAFTNFKMTPRTRWENNLSIRATKYLTTTLFGVMYYDKFSNAPEPNRVQYTSVISVGLTYTFRNK